MSKKQFLENFESRTLLEIKIDDLISDLNRFKKQLLTRKLDSKEFAKTLSSIQDAVTEVEMHSIHEKVENRKILKRQNTFKKKKKLPILSQNLPIEKNIRGCKIGTGYKPQIKVKRPRNIKRLTKLKSYFDIRGAMAVTGNINAIRLQTGDKELTDLSGKKVMRKNFKIDDMKKEVVEMNIEEKNTIPITFGKPQRSVRMSQEQKESSLLRLTDFYENHDVISQVHQFYESEKNKLYPYRNPHLVGTFGPQGNVSIVSSRITTKSLWQKNYDVMKQSIILHNKLVREELKACDGFEVSCFLDKFIYAFPTTHHAIEFSLRVQYRLMLLRWPESLLRYKETEEVKDETGKLIYRGLRVQMAVHNGKINGNGNKNREDYEGTVKEYCLKLLKKTKEGEISISERAYNKIREKMHIFSYHPKIVAREENNGDSYLLVIYPEELFQRALSKGINFWYLEEEEKGREMTENEFIKKLSKVFKMSTHFSMLKAIEKLEKKPPKSKLEDPSLGDVSPFPEEFDDQEEKVFMKIKLEVTSYLKVNLKKKIRVEVKDFLRDIYTVKKYVNVKKRIDTQKRKKRKAEKMKKKKGDNKQKPPRERKINNTSIESPKAKSKKQNEKEIEGKSSSGYSKVVLQKRKKKSKSTSGRRKKKKRSPKKKSKSMGGEENVREELSKTK